MPPRVPGQAPSWQRWLRRYRRPLAALLLAGAALLALRSVRPAPAPTDPVLVTTRDVAAGAVLGPDDVTVARWPDGLAPPGRLTAVEELPGRPLVAPVGAGEALVPARFLAPSVLAAYGAGLVATPVRLADAGAAALLHEGDVVDVLAATPGTAGDQLTTPARTVASGVRVLLAGHGPQDADPLAAAGPIADGSLVVLATTAQQAAAIAGAAATSRLSAVLRAS